MKVSLLLASLNINARSALMLLTEDGNKQLSLSLIELAIERAGIYRFCLRNSDVIVLATHFSEL